jgi:hypothetical protein
MACRAALNAIYVLTYICVVSGNMLLLPTHILHNTYMACRAALNAIIYVVCNICVVSGDMLLLLSCCSQWEHVAECAATALHAIYQLLLLCMLLLLSSSMQI